MKSTLFNLAAAALAVTAVEAGPSGTFNVLTMNVAGLPAILNDNAVPGDKGTNANLIGSYFAAYNYDIINVQEDFNYHAYIYATDDHPYRTATSGGVPFGSGLNTLANFDWTDFDRVTWATCSDASGADCLTPKGFTRMRVTVTEGVYVDVINLHADAGTEDGDEAARTANIQQVADYISASSSGNAVLVFGDTNSRFSRTADNIRVFESQNHLLDAWTVIEHNNVIPAEGSTCDNPSLINTCETVDKVFYRGNSVIDLQAVSFNYESTKFVQPDGSILSDHNPIRVDFVWKLSDTRRQSGFWGGPHGTWFNDLDSLPTTPQPTVLTFRGGSRLDSVGLTLSNGQVFTHGGTGGTSVSLTLAAKEYWTTAQLCQGVKDGHTRNFYIKATMNTGRTLTAGASTSDCKTFTAPAGFQVVGYLGQDGDEMDQLGFLYAPHP